MIHFLTSYDTSKAKQCVLHSFYGRKNVSPTRGATVPLRNETIAAESIATIRACFSGRCPEVTYSLIILAAAHEGMQAKQICSKHLYYTSLLAQAAENMLQ